MHRHQLDPKVSVSIVNVALPSLARQLGVPGTSIDAVVVAYLVSLAVVMPASGWLGDRWGTKRIFLLALMLFTVSSALCGLASSYAMLIVFRVLQGAAGGALTPVGTAMLYRTFPPSQRVQVSRVLIVPTVLAPALGPVLGGLLVTQLSWRYVFYVNVPIGIAACLFGFVFLYEHKEPTPGRFDLAGFLLGGIGLALVMYALSEGSSSGWISANILGSALTGALLLVAFVVIELRKREPMLDLHLLRDRLFRTTNLVSLFAYAGFLGILFVGPLFLQEALGVTALTSGLTTFPIGAGMAYAFLPLRVATFATISPTSTGRASAFYSAQNQLGAALGVAVLGTVLSTLGATTVSSTGVVQPNLAAYHAAFLAAAVLALIGACIALAISDRDAAVTMRRKSRTTERRDMPELIQSTEAHS